MWRSIDDNPSLQLARHELRLHAVRRPGMRQLAMEHQRRIVTAIGRVLERLPHADGGIDPVDLAHYVAATIDGLTLHRLLDEDPTTVDRRRRLHQRALERLATSG